MFVVVVACGGSTAATRMNLETRFSRSVTRTGTIYRPYADDARWARGLGLSTEAEWDEWVGLGEGRNALRGRDRPDATRC